MAVLVLSVVVRIAYYREASHGPLFWLNRSGQTDMAFFDTWARVIASGDWLTDRSLHPQHIWHAAIAARASPFGTDAPPGEDRSESSSARLWERWYGGKAFHQEPLYPYLVAAIYRIVAPDERVVFALQLLLGVVSTGLVIAIARRLFADPVPILAGAIAVLCSPLMQFEMLLLRESLIVMTGLLVAYLTLVALEKPQPIWWAMVGVAGGVAIVVKSSFALFLAPVVLFLASRHGPISGRLKAIAWLSLGTLFVWSPAIGRNLAVGRPAFELSSVGAITFVNSNCADAKPEEGFGISRHAPEIMAGTDGRPLPAAIAAISTHDDGASYAALLWRKLDAAWHWREIPDNSNFYLQRSYAAMLRLPATFFLIGPLGLIGLAVAAPRIGRAWPLYLLVASALATMLVFYPSSRFRAPMTAALIPFAAHAVVRSFSALADREWGRCLALALGLALAGVWIDRPLPSDRPVLRSVDCAQPFAVYYGPRLNALARQSDWRSYAAEAVDALRFEPDFVRELGPSRPPTGGDALGCAETFRQAHGRAAEALRRIGRDSDAAWHQRRVEELTAAIEEAGLPIGRQTKNP